jgi:hypothetical protein
MSNESHIHGLMDTVSQGYQRKKDLYEQMERYSSAAFKSGGSIEEKYKSMRNDASRSTDALQVEIEHAEQELLRAGYYTQIMPDGSVSFPRR